MLSWVWRRRTHTGRRSRADRIEAEANALISAFGREAYVMAHQREIDAVSDESARQWRRIALAVADKTATRAGRDVSNRMTAGADFKDRGSTFSRPR
jgi:hypothetical protein